MKKLKAHVQLDAKGLACPMPIVKTKKTISTLNEGEVLEIQATDRGSKADLKAWAESTGHHYLGTIEDGEVLFHYIRKQSSSENVEKHHPHIVSNKQLLEKIESNDIIILDVREEAEYAFSHIEGAISIPLGELDNRLKELEKDKEIYVICRTGSRSDLAAQKLVQHGFPIVYNVVPGMSGWNGDTKSNIL